MKRLEAIGEVTTKQIKTSNTGTTTAHQVWSQPKYAGQPIFKIVKELRLCLVDDCSDSEYVMLTE